MWVAGGLSLPRTYRLTGTFVEVLQGGHNLESPSTPKRTATSRSVDDQESVRYGVGVDDEREHQPVCDGTPL